MPYVPNKIAQDIEMKKKVLRTYFLPAELKGLVEQYGAPYSYSSIHSIINDKMRLLVQEIEDERHG